MGRYVEYSMGIFFKRRIVGHRLRVFIMRKAEFKHLDSTEESMKKNKGFTLVEVMIVVLIVAILSAIALPSYQKYVIRGKVPIAIATLSDMQAKLEQYFQDQRTYDGACKPGTLAPEPPETPEFKFTCPTLSATAYVIVAEGKGRMKDFKYTVNEKNQKKTESLPSDWGPADSTCWVVRPGGC